MKTEKITHMQRRWGTPQNFCLTFIGEFEKQLFIKKNPVKWANKKFKNLNIYNAAFKKKKEKHLAISLFYISVPKILMI